MATTARRKSQKAFQESATDAEFEAHLFGPDPDWSGHFMTEADYQVMRGWGWTPRKIHAHEHQETWFDGPRKHLHLQQARSF